MQLQAVSVLQVGMKLTVIWIKFEGFSSYTKTPASRYLCTVKTTGTCHVRATGMIPFQNPTRSSSHLMRRHLTALTSVTRWSLTFRANFSLWRLFSSSYQLEVVDITGMRTRTRIYQERHTPQMRNSGNATHRASAAGVLMSLIFNTY